MSVWKILPLRSKKSPESPPHPTPVHAMTVHVQPWADTMARHTVLFIICFLVIFIRGVSAKRTVYFDKYGDCSAEDAYDLSDREYFVRSTGGGFAHENLLCDLSFEAAPGLGICLTFEEFEIEDCDVRLNIYQAPNNAQGIPWRSYSCSNPAPAQLCSNDRYMTLEVKKSRMNNNLGYVFLIKVEETSTMSGEGALFASLGIVVAIIVGVVVVCCVISLLFYCCCKRRREHLKEMEDPSNAPPQHQQQALVAPSAPPVDAAYYPYGPNIPMNDPRTPIASQMEPPPPYGSPSHIPYNVPPPPPYNE